MSIINFVLYFCTVSVAPPVEYVSVPDGNATFTCYTVGNDKIISVNWIVNDTDIDHQTLINVTPEFSSIGIGVGTLTFTFILPTYNMTRVKCSAVYAGNGGESTSVETTLLLLQG